MKKYNLDTDNVTFSIVKASNNAFYVVEKIQCMLPRDYYKSKPIYFYEDIRKEIEERINLYKKTMSQDYKWKFIINTNWHNIPSHNIKSFSWYNNPLTPSL